MRIQVGFLCAVLACAPALAQVYKWVDANGVTHYSEKPPENGQAKEVPLREASPASSNPKPASSASEQERAFKQRQLAREQAEAKAEKDKAANDAQCKQLLSGLNTMRSVGRIASVNDKGEREYMTDEQRDALIASREQEYNQHCN